MYSGGEITSFNYKCRAKRISRNLTISNVDAVSALIHSAVIRVSPNPVEAKPSDRSMTSHWWFYFCYKPTLICCFLHMCKNCC